jgi:hypothetical protein
MTTAASKNSFAKSPPAIKYPEKRDPAAPIVNMAAAVSNKRNRPSSGKISVSGGKHLLWSFNENTGFSQYSKQKYCGKIKSTIAFWASALILKHAGKTSVIDPKTKGSSMDMRKCVTCRFRGV